MSYAQQVIQTMSLKSNDSIHKTIALAFMAGIYISFGAFLYSLATATSIQPTVAKLFGSLLFTIGLNFVVFFKAQLFTGNNLMFVGILKKEIPFLKLVRNWSFVFFGNFLGALFIVSILTPLISDVEFLSERLIAISKLKTNYSFAIAFVKAILCNILVCLAIFFGIIMKTKLTKIIGIVIPITIFVFMGFEHSIANIFFVPFGLALDSVASKEALTLFLNNLVPVTLGNIVGGFIVSLGITFNKSQSNY